MAQLHEHLTVKNGIGIAVVLIVIVAGVWGYTGKTKSYQSAPSAPAPVVIDIMSEAHPMMQEANPFDTGYTNPFDN